MTTLYLHSEEERYDLAEWLRCHDGEPDYPAGMSMTADWLCALTVGDYPARVPVPAEHVEPMNVIIDDWIEVLAAHDESLESRLEVTP